MSISASSVKPTSSNALSTASSFFLRRNENKLLVERVPREISSRTVIRIFVGILAALWETHPTFPLKLMFCGLCPKTVTLPFAGCKIPKTVNKNVDLPPPFGPTIPTNSPLLMRKFTSSRTSFPDRTTDRFVASNMEGAPETLLDEIACTTTAPGHGLGLFYNIPRVSHGSTCGEELRSDLVCNVQEYTPHKNNGQHVHCMHIQSSEFNSPRSAAQSSLEAVEVLLP